MKIETKPWAGGFLAALLWLCFVVFAVLTSGCIRETRGRDPGVAFESTVLITITCPVGMGYGSGVIVNDHTVLTAAHVATDPDGMFCMRTATMVNGRQFLLAPGKILPDQDLASLHLVIERFDPTFPVTFARKPGYGARVCAMTAFPRFLWRCGDVQTTEDLPGDLSHTIVVEPGNSGSGVYDTRGRLVGIITHRWSCSNGQLCGGKLATLEGHVEDLLRE